MPYCPRCNKEYKEIYRLCPACNTIMLDNKPPVQKRAHLSNSEIQRIFNEIDGLFLSKGITHNNFYVLPFEIKENLIYDSNLVQTLQKIADNMCFFLGLLVPPHLIYIEEGLDRYNNLNRIFSCETNGTVRTFEKERDFAGLYDSKYGQQQIQLVKKKGYKISHLLGTLAHEITHHFLHHYGIEKSNERENEIFTDLTAVYLGFGHLIHRAYKVITFNTDYIEKEDNSFSYTTHERTIGYITPETILRALAIISETKGWNPKEIIKSIDTGDDRSNISRKLLNYRIRLLKTRLSSFQEKVKSQKQTNKYQKTINTLYRIQQKYDKVKYTLDKLSHTNINIISKEDGEFLVELSGQIFTSSVEVEIRNKIKRTNDAKNNIDSLDREFYRSIKTLESQMNFWLSRLNAIK